MNAKLSTTVPSRKFDAPSYFELTDEEWERVGPMLTARGSREARGARSSIDARRILDGILWVRQFGKPWSSIPRRYPPYKTCCRYFANWRCTGTLQMVEQELFGTVVTYNESTERHDDQVG